jgi:hypothetical protein
MIELNFYKKYSTDWNKLKELALQIIDDFEMEDAEILEEGGELDEVEGEIPFSEQYSDYRQAINLGLKTFILQVIVDWDEQDIIVKDNIFYKNFTKLEIEGTLEDMQPPKLFSNQVDLLKVFSDQKMKLSTDDFDFILDTFESDVVVALSSYDIRIIDIEDYDEDEDDDF